jgi:hypothetical protein
VRAPSSLALLLLASGCLSAPVYRTARTLPRGEFDLGGTLSATRFSVREQQLDQNGTPTSTNDTSVTLPNVVPEVFAHYGATDDVEIGGRVALSSLMVELETKIRLIGDAASHAHLAIQPALGYQTLIVVEGVRATLPLVYTQDLNEDLSINLAPFVQYLGYSATSSTTESDLRSFGRRSVLAGGSVGLQFRFTNASVMPALAYTRFVDQLDKVAAGTTTTSFAQDYIVFSMTLGVFTNRRH